MLDAVQLNCIHVQGTKSVADEANFAALSKLSEIMVPKLTDENYEIFTTAFCSIVERTIIMNGIPIDYIICGVNGDHDSPWTNREDNLKNRLLYTGNYFKNENISLYSLYSQYISTKGVDSNIINKYHSKNDRKCHQYSELHFRNNAYLANKVTAATSTINSAVYNGNSQKLHP